MKSSSPHSQRVWSLGLQGRRSEEVAALRNNRATALAAVGTFVGYGPEAYGKERPPLPSKTTRVCAMEQKAMRSRVVKTV